jgi:hypothetical protein
MRLFQEFLPSMDDTESLNDSVLSCAKFGLPDACLSGGKCYCMNFRSILYLSASELIRCFREISKQRSLVYLTSQNPRCDVILDLLFSPPSLGVNLKHYNCIITLMNIE